MTRFSLLGELPPGVFLLQKLVWSGLDTRGSRTGSWSAARRRVQGTVLTSTSHSLRVLCDSKQVPWGDVYT